MSPTERGAGEGRPTRTIEAVVFDCDGTIADTESVAESAWRATLLDHSYVATDDDFAAVIGHPFPQNWDHFSARVDLGDQEDFRARLRARFIATMDAGLDVYPDAVEAMRELAAAGVALAVASSSTRRHVERVLDRVGVAGLVRAVVAVEDVHEHKPLPGPYLAAIAALRIGPERAGAVEDTPVGIASARAAGLYTVGVRRRAMPVERLAQAHRVVERIDAVVFATDRAAGPTLRDR
jgi:HAD superfamily hydrolase (TIGR01509 family)